MQMLRNGFHVASEAQWQPLADGSSESPRSAAGVRVGRHPGRESVPFSDILVSGVASSLSTDRAAIVMALQDGRPDPYSPGRLLKSAESLPGVSDAPVAHLLSVSSLPSSLAPTAGDDATARVWICLICAKLSAGDEAARQHELQEVLKFHRHSGVPGMMMQASSLPTLIPATGSGRARIEAAACSVGLLASASSDDRQPWAPAGRHATAASAVAHGAGGSGAASASASFSGLGEKVVSSSKERAQSAVLTGATTDCVASSVPPKLPAAIASPSRADNRTEAALAAGCVADKEASPSPSLRSRWTAHRSATGTSSSCADAVAVCQSSSLTAAASACGTSSSSAAIDGAGGDVSKAAITGKRLYPEVRGERVAVTMWPRGLSQESEVQFLTPEEAAAARKGMGEDLRLRWERENVLVNKCLHRGIQCLQRRMLVWPELQAAEGKRRAATGAAETSDTKALSPLQQTETSSSAAAASAQLGAVLPFGEPPSPHLRLAVKRPSLSPRTESPDLLRSGSREAPYMGIDGHVDHYSEGSGVGAGTDTSCGSGSGSGLAIDLATSSGKHSFTDCLPGSQADPGPVVGSDLLGSLSSSADSSSGTNSGSGPGLRLPESGRRQGMAPRLIRSDDCVFNVEDSEDDRGASDDSSSAAARDDSSDSEGSTPGSSEIDQPTVPVVVTTVAAELRRGTRARRASYRVQQQEEAGEAASGSGAGCGVGGTSLALAADGPGKSYLPAGKLVADAAAVACCGRPHEHVPTMHEQLC